MLTLASLGAASVQPGAGVQRWRTICLIGSLVAAENAALAHLRAAGFAVVTAAAILGRVAATPRFTWDGVPIAPDEPHGAAILARRPADGGLHEYLVLHRAHRGPDYEGDWAWTPPSGSRQPGEPVWRPHCANWPRKPVCRLLQQTCAPSI